LTGADVVAVYGSTEAEPIAHVSRTEIGDREKAAMRGGGGLIAGRPVPETTVRIVPIGYDDRQRAAALAADAAPLPAGARGEIIVSGAHVVPGYLHGRGDAETKVRVDGTVWHRTGDAGYHDAGGRLWLLGRAGASVADSRGELHPFAVECAARLVMPRRRTALVSHGGERILLVEGALAPAERAAVSTALGWARLDRIIDRVAIPLDKRHNSKVDYRALGRLVPRLAGAGR
jgi:acyl-CoA synthetase (AMP-forming)/AMP-acid ligase II